MRRMTLVIDIAATSIASYGVVQVPNRPGGCDALRGIVKLLLGRRRAERALAVKAVLVERLFSPCSLLL